MARRFRGLRTTAAGLTLAIGLGAPATAAQGATETQGVTGTLGAASGYTPSPQEWWMTEWAVPQQVWPLSEGAGVTVAVVDTGVQANIPDLRGAVVPGGDMVGDPGRGEIDRAVGEDGHGTKVAVLIAGQGAANDGAVGLAPKAKILPVYAQAGDNVGAGIRYAVDHGAKVINISLAGASSAAIPCAPEDQEAVAYAVSHNVAVVAAAGNTDKDGAGPVSPASCPGVLAVGGVEKSGALWPGSVPGSYMSVAGPADNVFVTGIDGRHGSGGAGTSFAAPLVAAAAALIRSRYPSMPWYQVDQRIIATALHINGVPVPSNGYGYGIANVAKALNVSAFPVPASAPDPPYTRYLAWLKSSDGRAWAKQNGVTVPGSSTAAGGSSGGNPPAAGSSAAKPASSSSSTIVLIAIVVVVVIIASTLVLVLRSRRRSRPGSHPPGSWQQR